MGSFRGGASQRGNPVPFLTGATALAVLTQPAGAVTAVAFTTQPVIEIRDRAGNRVTNSTAPVTVAIASGSGSLSGTTTVNAVAGRATFTNLVLTGADTYTLSFTSSPIMGLWPVTSSSLVVSSGAGFAAPDIYGPSDFSAGFQDWTAWGSGTPTGVTRVQEGKSAEASGWSVKDSWTNTGSGGGSQFSHATGSRDQVYIRFYFYITQTPSDSWKWCRVDGNHGGLFLGDVGAGRIGMCWDDENQSSISPITPAGADIRNALHSIEMLYMRNGHASGFPAAQFWYDGDPCYAEFNGNSTIQYHNVGDLPGNPNNKNNTTWVNGVMIAGQRDSSAQITLYDLMSTFNGSNAAGECHISNVAISTQRIGP